MSTNTIESVCAETQKPFGGTIKNWGIWNWSEDAQVVSGDLFGDPGFRFPEGEYIRTSRIIRVIPLSETDAILETRNTVYKLEEKAVQSL